jgi:RNA polymerase sigma-70 factor (ECF subfamily)
LRGQAADVADDVASETWIAASRGLRAFSGDADAFRAWLFTIARHRLIDARRSAKRQVPTVSADAAIFDSAALAMSTEDAALHAVAGDEAVRRIVALLPADQAEAILLRVVADLSVEQVAAIIGKRPGTVRVLQSRGLKRLAERLRKNL